MQTLSDINNTSNHKFSKELNIDYKDIDYQKGGLSPRTLFSTALTDNESPIINNISNIKNSNEAINQNSIIKNNLTSQNKLKNKNSNDNLNILLNNTQSNSNNKIILNKKSNYNKITTMVESYLDFVNKLYFSSDLDNCKIEMCYNEKLINNDLIENDLTTNKSDILNSNLSNVTVENKNTSDNKFKLTSLDFLINPLRSSLPFEKWSPYEIAVFQSCICKYGRDFELIHKFIPNKSIGDIIEFYYQWEATKYYNLWSINQMKKTKYLIN